MNKLLALYKDILHSLDLTFDEQGLATRVDEDGSTPIMVERKRLALPHTELLRSSPWDNVVAFHPLSENVMMGESPVLKHLKSMINLKLTSSVSKLFVSLIEIAADTDSHSRLTSKQKQLLKEIDVDAKSVAAAVSVIDRVDMTKNKMVNIYLRRGGKLEGKPYQRVAVVSFPIMDWFDPLEIETKDEQGKVKKHYQIFERDLRKRDKEAFISFFKWLFPEEMISSFSVGSNSSVAPYFDALMKAFIRVTNRLNEIAEIFKKPLGENYHEIHNPLYYAEALEDLTPYRFDIVSPLPFNDGSSDSGGVTAPPKNANWDNPNQPMTPPMVNPAMAQPNWPMAQPQMPVYNNAPFAQFAKNPVVQQQQPFYPPTQPMYPQQQPLFAQFAVNKNQQQPSYGYPTTPII